MVIAILAANRGYRPMTTVDQTTHFMRAVTSADMLADPRVVRPRAHHELWPCHLVERHRQQAGGDGQQRLCGAVSARRFRN
jgi:acyl-coenzyme A thioesterase PaaI-like protein